jgi:tetratricopeptide (TPR) repeat protein
LLQYPNDEKFLSYKILGLLEAGRFKEAKQEYSKLPKQSSSAELRKQVNAQILELMGDEAMKEGKLAQAVQTYRRAIAQSTRSRHIRAKVAIALLNYARSKNYVPAETIAQDMDYALDVIEPTVSEAVVAEDLLLDVIEICLYSNKRTKGPDFCDRYQRDFGVFKAAKSAIYCSKLYSSHGQRGKARSLLEASMKTIKDGAANDSLFKELKRVGL